MKELEMKNCNREVAKISSLLSGKSDKYEYLPGGKNTTFRPKKSDRTR